jgi:hypothetical protein
MACEVGKRTEPFAAIPNRRNRARGQTKTRQRQQTTQIERPLLPGVCSPSPFDRRGSGRLPCPVKGHASFILFEPAPWWNEPSFRKMAGDTPFPNRGLWLAWRSGENAGISVHRANKGVALSEALAFRVDPDLSSGSTDGVAPPVSPSPQPSLCGRKAEATVRRTGLGTLVDVR